MRNDAQILRKVFVKHGIGPKDLVGSPLNSSYLYRILRGGYPLTITYAMRISEALGIPLSELRPDVFEKFDVRPPGDPKIRPSDACASGEGKLRQENKDK